MQKSYVSLQSQQSMDPEPYWGYVEHSFRQESWPYYNSDKGYLFILSI